MSTPGSHAEPNTLPPAGGAEPRVERIETVIFLDPRDKRALREALHRDFDDARDLPHAASGNGAPGAVGDAWSATLPDDPRAPPSTRRGPWTPFQWFLVALGILAVAQVPLMWAFLETRAGDGPVVFTCLDLGTPRADQMSLRERLALEQRCNPGATRSIETFLRADPTQDPLPEDAQVVELTQPEAKDPQPVDTKYLADVTTRTDKETRSEVAARTQHGRGGAKTESKPDAAPHATSPEPTRAPADAEVARPDQDPVDTVGKPDVDKGQELPPRIADIVDMQKGAGVVVPDKELKPPGGGGGGDRILRRAGSEADTLANIQALAGDFTSNDHLPDVERGKDTVLNANSYKYADFFHNVKRAVERQWRPSETYLRRDPTGQVYGVKDRYTVLRVELDRAGKVVSLVVVKPSGLDFMDEEAKRSFREAQPFQNPPLGLADADGKIRFEFGFYFEITGGKYRFNWRRL